jgi:glycosyltransferase involved in cell wall biosynthesis
MKILQSCGSASWGGLEILALRTTLQLIQRGHKVHLLCRQDSKLEKEALRNNIEIISLPAKSAIKSIIRTKKIIEAEKYEIIHTHLSHDLWILVPALKLSGSNSKLFLTRHMGSGISKKDIFHKYLYNRVNRIFAISNYVKQNVLKTCPVNNDKVSVLHPAINVNDYAPESFNRKKLREALGIDNESIIIGIASRISPGKGYEEFLEAAKILKSEFPDEIYFLAAGGKSRGEEEYFNNIMRLTHELGLDNAVKYIGFRENIAEVLSIMDIFVFPSHEESFGVLLLEAMAARLPSVASNNAGIPDIVINGETGILIPPKDAVRLADAVKRLIVDKDLRTKLGREARKRAEGIFNINDALDKLEKFYGG